MTVGSTCFYVITHAFVLWTLDTRDAAVTTVSTALLPLDTLCNSQIATIDCRDVACAEHTTHRPPHLILHTSPTTTAVFDDTRCFFSYDATNAMLRVTGRYPDHHLDHKPLLCSVTHIEFFRLHNLCFAVQATQTGSEVRTFRTTTGLPCLDRTTRR